MKHGRIFQLMESGNVLFLRIEAVVIYRVWVRPDEKMVKNLP